MKLFYLALLIVAVTNFQPACASIKRCDFEDLEGYLRRLHQKLAKVMSRFVSLKMCSRSPEFWEDYELYKRLQRGSNRGNNSTLIHLAKLGAKWIYKCLDFNNDGRLTERERKFLQHFLGHNETCYKSYMRRCFRNFDNISHKAWMDCVIEQGIDGAIYAVPDLRLIPKSGFKCGNGFFRCANSCYKAVRHPYIGAWTVGTCRGAAKHALPAFPRDSEQLECLRRVSQPDSYNWLGVCYHRDSIISIDGVSLDSGKYIRRLNVRVEADNQTTSYLYLTLVGSQYGEEQHLVFQNRWMPLYNQQNGYVICQQDTAHHYVERNSLQTECWTELT